MNHTATPFTAFPVSEQIAVDDNQDWKSILKRIFVRLVSSTRRDKFEIRAYRGNNSFIDELLLDPRMGPEISRTLRR